MDGRLDVEGQADPREPARAADLPRCQPVSLLVLEDVHTYYGEAHILQGVSLTVGEGEVDGEAEVVAAAAGDVAVADEVFAADAAGPLHHGERRADRAVGVEDLEGEALGGGAALLVDCGVAQGDEAAAWQFPEAARDARAVVLTHGHNDHCGSLPALLDCSWDGPIYGTRPTLEIADFVLSDGLGQPQTGTEGQVVFGKYRILKIGVESIEMAYLDGRGRQTIRLSGS